MKRAYRSVLPVMMALAVLATAPFSPSIGEEYPLRTNVDAIELSVKKQTTLGLYVTAKEAAAALRTHRDILLIDVRTRAEAMFVGIADPAVRNIPFTVLGFYNFNPKKHAYKLLPNPQFADAVGALLKERNLEQDTILILTCRSGGRSARAANALAKLGYENVYSMIDGFEGDKDKDGKRTVNGWKNSGLPWSYKLKPDQIYRSPGS